jgi:hypothetical protein
MISRFSLFASLILFAGATVQAQPLAPPEVKGLLDRIFPHTRTRFAPEGGFRG